MQYRLLGKTGFNGSVLGFGAMRLPEKDGEIDEHQADEMLMYSIDKGVNYVDTSYMYHNGQSEIWLGKKLKGGLRDKIKLATKLPSWLIKQKPDLDKYFNEQLERLQTDRIEFYLFHTLNSEYWENLKSLGAIEWAEKKIKEGRIGHLGFSFHHNYQAFENIINDYDWKFCQIQYNFMDIDNQAGTKGLKLAHSKGIPVIIMEPLLGGRLVDPPGSIQNIWDESPVKRGNIEWALQWLWNQEEVSMVLSGMSNITQVKQNIEYAEKSRVNLLTEEEMALFDRVRQKYNDLIIVNCTKCGYCMPCDFGVNIPRMFDVYNNASIYDKMQSAKGEYGWIGHSFKLGLTKTDERAINCTQCGSCETKCPQKIPISGWMKKIDETLGAK